MNCIIVFIGKISKMIYTKKDFKEYWDYEKNFLKYPLSIYIPFDIYEQQIIGKFLRILRKTEYHVNSKHFFRKFYYLIRLKRKQCKYGLHIPINVFEKGLSIAHIGTIVVNGNCKIGKNCRIHVGTVLGSNGKNYRGGVPELGDNIYLGSGAKVFGQIYIENGCKIGANAVVNKSCYHKNCILVGVPAKEIICEK